MKGYKCVTVREDGSLVSLVAGGQGGDPGRMRVYAEGETTCPEVGDGGLAVFTERAEALHFTKDWPMPLTACYECEYVPSDTPSLWCRYEGRIWKRVEIDSLPPATAIASSVTLGRRIALYDNVKGEWEYVA